MTPVRDIRVRLVAGLDLVGADELAALVFGLTALASIAGGVWLAGWLR